MRQLKRHNGQAMSEFLVAAAFVVVPLFILVPVVGKYIDMKLATVEAARYGAWEYTVNYSSHSELSSGFREAGQPVKTRAQVAREAERRFYSDTSLVIDSAKDRAGFQSKDAKPLWRYHNGLPMYKPSGKSTVKIDGPLDTPDTTGFMRSLVRGFGGLAEFFGGLFEKIGVDANFDAIDSRGKYTASVSMPVQPAPLHRGLSASDQKPLFGETLNLQMQAKAGVLGQSWSAGGKSHTVYRSGGLIPTPVLGKAYETFAGPVFGVLSKIPVLNTSVKEFAPDSLIFGYPTNDPQVMDEVPTGKLNTEERELSCQGGYCVY